MLAKEIAAFANGQGGQLFLGVEDDGAITGAGTLREADQLMQRVSAACQTSVQPAVWCSILGMSQYTATPRTSHRPPKKRRLLSSKAFAGMPAEA